MTGQRPIRVLVADDQAIVRDGLVTVLGLADGIEVVGEAADGAAAIALATERCPDVVLMDLRMPGIGGAEATAAVRAAVPSAAVLVLTTFGDDDSIAAALRAGARGYLTKDASRTEVAAAIHAVAAGATTFSADVGARLLGAFDGTTRERTATGPTDHPTQTPADQMGSPAAPNLRARFPTLTRREAEVLALIARGRSNSEIASDLVVSPATVKTHINSLFAKLGARDRAQAVALALRPAPY